jgi:hypothetical protein
LVYPIDLDPKGRLFLPLELPVNDVTLAGGRLEIRVTDTGGRTGSGTVTLKTPTMTVSPAISTRGSLVKVTGEDFVVVSRNNASRYLIDVEYAGERVATTEINPSGAFDVSFSVPSESAPGSDNVVSAKVQRLPSEVEACHSVPDTNIAIEPTNVPRGGKLVISGTGLSAVQRVWIKVGDTWVTLTGLYTDANGAFRHTVWLPERISLGKQVIRVNTRSFSQNFAVTVTRK